VAEVERYRRREESEEEGEEDGEEEGEEEGEVDWEVARDERAVQLRGMLACREYGLHEDDERTIDHVMSRREVGVESRSAYENVAEWQHDVLTALCKRVLNMPPPESSYLPESGPDRIAEDLRLDEEMDRDRQAWGSQAQSSEHASMSQPSLSSQGSPAVPVAVASPGTSSAAVSSPLARPNLPRGPGAPSWKATAGKAAESFVKSVGRMRTRHQKKAAAAAFAERMEHEGGPTISEDTAKRQARALSDFLYTKAGSVVNAQMVAKEFSLLPQVCILVDFAMAPDAEITARLVQNVIKFFEDHLRTKGSRSPAVR